MSDRCSCVPDGPNYRCGIGRPCDVHGDVDAILRYGEYVDRRGRRWLRILTFHSRERLWRAVGSRRPYRSNYQMRKRIEREHHREVCPGLSDCELHPWPMVWRWRGSWWFGSGWDTHRFATFAEAIDAAQQLAKEAS